jgi:hypothetical protein
LKFLPLAFCTLSWTLLAAEFAAAQSPVFTGPCTRRTSVVLSEIQYHPADDVTANAREFIELYNSSPISVDLSGWKLRGDVDFDIPAGTRLEGGCFLVIAADPVALQAGGASGVVLGPWTGVLSNNSGTVRLRKASGGIVLETNYDDDNPWPIAADGSGHSMVLARPSFGESQPQAWAASDQPGGSPNALDVASDSALDRVLISEIAATGTTFVEFYNPGPGDADLSGCSVSTLPETTGDVLSANTILTAGSYLSYNLAIVAGDKEIYLKAADGLRVLDAVQFTPQEAGHSWDREHELTTPTPGAVNSARFQRPVVINEIHYNPPGDVDADEFIELHNYGATTADLAGWKIADAVSYAFPAGTTIASGAYLVVNAAQFSGSLSNSSERIVLTNAQGVITDEVTYFDGGRWPTQPDGGGTSLQLIDPHSDNALAPNWTAGDESGSAVTFTVEHTGITDLGHPKTPTATRAFIMMMGKGEMIVDDVEVIVGGQNRIANSNFSNGVTGWNFFGTHKPSVSENGALHVVATDGGDLANLIETTLTSVIPAGTTVTLRAQCRWVSGDPEILLGLNGGWLEAAASLPIPQNAGTPGAANFSMGNAGPAITEVSHSPHLPQANDPITVTARIDDPDTVAPRLRYRIDPASSFSQITMTEIGDGFYSATIPGQSFGSMIVFHIRAIDDGSPRVITTFPADIAEQECLVRVGETTPAGDLSTYRIWITQATHDEWRDRVRSSNLELDATVVSDGRVFYNCGVQYAGSQNGVTIYDSPTGNPSGYNITVPNDEVFLNVQKMTLDRETTRDATRQRERLMFWFLEKLGLPNLHRRYVHVYLNGVKRDTLIMEDVQKPNSDIMDELFADKGRLTKMNPWFEFDPNGNVQTGAGGALTNRLEHFKTTGGALKLPRYRWTWSHGAGHDSAHDYSGISALIDATEVPDAELAATFGARADLRQWMRTFAMNDLASYWDTFGNPGSKNAYLFESTETGIWSVVTWDMDVGLGVFNDPVNAALFPGNVDSQITRLYNQPGIVREYWQALDESLTSFFMTGGVSEIDAILQETYDVLIANGAAVTSPFDPSGPYGLSVTEWIDQRRTFLLGELAGKSSAFTATGPASSAEVFVTISGTAPLNTALITSNGTALDLSWTSSNAWSAQVALLSGANLLLIEARDQTGAVIDSGTLNITFTEMSVWADLKINEWMASNPVSSGIVDPADGNSDDWFEIYNPTAETVSLDGWYLSDDPATPLLYRVPNGFSIPTGGHALIWADDQPGLSLSQIHVPFKLSAGGESIILSAPDGTEIDRVDFGSQTSGIAQRRVPDGGAEIGFTLAATPGAENCSGAAPVAAMDLNVSAVSIGFSSVSGSIYQIELSTDLTNWMTNGAPVAGTGVAMTFPIPTPAVDRLFLRIRSY